MRANSQVRSGDVADVHRTIEQDIKCAPESRCRVERGRRPEALTVTRHELARLFVSGGNRAPHLAAAAPRMVRGYPHHLVRQASRHARHRSQQGDEQRERMRAKVLQASVGLVAPG